MTNPTLPIERSKWDVPSHQVIFWNGRRHDYAVVIPVIDEGDRLVKLLTRMASLNIFEYADILVVDGGSTDGSTEQNNLRSLRAAGLVLKTGHGKLSAQLRCAYAFVLDQGYEGVVTIDGNNKDDPAAIGDFIASLKDGTDFVQASRYIPGGVAENTPRVRDFAIRLIHAPMLRIFSGFPWTDTTQGFRGYSRALLLDPRLALFRDIFSTYELLAYLSYRAPRLGYRCQELPTRRSYPQGEISTKISGIRGNARILKILIAACIGRYNPW